MSQAQFNDVHARFCELLKLAEERLNGGDTLTAAGLAQIAARYVFPGKGIFASPRLERLLIEIGKRIPVASTAQKPSTKSRRRKVLHILTHARPIGGDTRFAWRWIESDTSSQHSVAITTQTAVSDLFKLPESLKQAAESSGGSVHALRAPASKPLEQAQELRSICQEADVVVLHVFPYDITPVLALAAGCDHVKTVYVNLSDHTFWIGASVAHWIVHLRRQSTAFLRNERGLDPDKSAILPIPLVPKSTSMSREEAKRALGYKPDTVLMLTIATPFKYNAPGHVSLLDLATPVLQQFPQAMLVAVGPKPEGAWQEASEKTGGRVVALGTRWDTDLFYAAADIYLDSVPFSSMTSLLEAGSLGVPLVGYTPNDELDLLGPGAPGLEDAMKLAVEPDSYSKLLGRLITDEEFRHDCGLRIKEKIISLHTGENWNHALANVYAQLEQTADRSCLVAEDDTFKTQALDISLAQLYSSVPFNTRVLIRDHLVDVPYSARVTTTCKLFRAGFDLCLLNILPPPADRVLHGLGRRAKRGVQRVLRRK